MINVLVGQASMNPEDGSKVCQADARVVNEYLLSVSGLWQEPFPESAPATEFSAFTWTSVTSKHTWNPALLFVYTEANIFSRKSPQATDTMGGSVKEPLRLRGRSLHVSEPPIICCFHREVRSSPQVPARAAG